MCFKLSLYFWNTFENKVQKHISYFYVLHRTWPLDTHLKGLNWCNSPNNSEFWVVECEIDKIYLLQKIFSLCAKASGHLINHRNWTDKLGPQVNLKKIVFHSTEKSKITLITVCYTKRMNVYVYQKE